MVYYPAAPVLKLRCAQSLHHEAESLVKQLGPRIRDGHIEGRAAMLTSLKTLKQMAHETRAYSLAA